MSHDGEFAAVSRRVNNRGRWGEHDELGTLNHISAGKRVAAAALVRTGLVVSLAHPISSREAGPAGRLVLHMQYGRPPEDSGVPWSAGDRVEIQVHASALTHVDCLSHIADRDHRVYNGRDFDAVAQAEGLTHGSVFAQRNGVLTRGVLLDLPDALGVPWIEPDRLIGVRELEAGERHGSVRVEPGDVVLLRVGAEPRIASAPPGPVTSPGLDAAAIAWLHDRSVAAFGGDAPDRVTERGARLLAGQDREDEAPSPYLFPLHQVAIPAMGLVLFDHCAVEELARMCRQLGRHEFLFVALPLPIRGGSGSPVNPVAVF